MLADLKCRYCKEPATRLLLTAMLQDLGCSVSNPADHCRARDVEGEPSLPHDFTEPPQQEKPA